MPKNVSFGPAGATYYGDAFDLAPAGTVRTSAGSMGARAVARIHTLRLALAVSAFTGTSVTFTIEQSPDGTTWTAHPTGAFTAVTAPGSQRKVISGLDRFVRLAYAGTFTSVTFGLTGESMGGEETD